MAVSTTTTMNDIVGSEVIEVVAQSYVSDTLIVTPFTKPFDLPPGSGSNTKQIWKLASNLGTVGAAGAGVDTEFNATEGTDLSATTLSTDKVSISLSEYGIRRDLSYNIEEDSLAGIDFITVVLQDSARVLATAWEDDLCALCGEFSNTSGSTGVDMSITTLSAAVVAIRNRGVVAPNGVVGLFDDQAAADLENSVVATSTDTYATYPQTAAAFFGVERDPANGMGNGYFGTFRGVPCYRSGLFDTANTAADVESCVMVHNTPANTSYAAMGAVYGRPFTLETQKNIEGRVNKFVATFRRGAGELDDNCGQTIISGAS